MIRMICALFLALASTIVGQTGGTAEPFQFVSGRAYQGAVVPASRIPDWYKEPGVTGTWTATAADVAKAEAVLSRYLTEALAEPLGVSPPIELRPDRPPYHVDGLRSLVKRLPECQRQYMGLTYGPERRLLVRGFLGAFNKRWREEVVTVIDGGCGYWYFELDVATQRPLGFGCQSDA